MTMHEIFFFMHAVFYKQHHTQGSQGEKKTIHL